MNYGLKMPIEIDENWLLILRSAYSSRASLGAGLSAVTAAILTENGFAILAAVLTFISLLGRVIVQPVLRKQLEQSSECLKNVKFD